MGAALMTLAGCQKAAPAEDVNAWVYDDSEPVPVQMRSTSNLGVSSKAIKDGLVTGSVMSGLDIGVICVAEKTSDSTPLTWSADLENSILIDNRSVTTGDDGSVTFSPKVYYPFGNQYAYSFYSYYPYTNSDSEAATLSDGAYSITYSLGNTDILWASSKATDYNNVAGFNAAYCRAVKKDGKESEYYPKLQYKHLLTALTFRIVGKEADIESYDIKVTGLQIKGTSTKATLCVADSNGSDSGKLTGNGDGGSIGFTELSVAPGTTEKDLCTILALPSASYSATITLTHTVSGSVQTSTVDFTMGDATSGSSYEAGYIYYFTVTINDPEEATVVETGLDEWQTGTNPTPGTEI